MVDEASEKTRFEWNAEAGQLAWPDDLKDQKENFKNFLKSPSQLSSENIHFL